MQARERQVVQNEVRFRALNERLRQSGSTWQGHEGVLSVVCECGDEDCTRPIELTPGEYESVRAEETQFVVVPEHARRDVEDVVTERDEWVVVRKRGEAAAIAASTDPRTE